MKGSIVYKGERIAKGSEAFELHEAKEFKKLDQHMRKVNFEAIERGEIRERKPVTSSIVLDSVKKADVVTAFGPRPDEVAPRSDEFFIAMFDSNNGQKVVHEGDPVDEGAWRRLMDQVKGFSPGELVIIGGNRRTGKSRLADFMLGVHKERQDAGRQKLRVEMVKARALPGDSGLTLGDIHAPFHGLDNTYPPASKDQPT